jgi:hypothetical protein
MATFGKIPPEGGNDWYLGDPTIVGCKFSLPENGEVTKISVYQYYGLNCKCAVYGVDGSFKGQTVQVYYDGPSEWIDYAFTTPLALPAGEYYLCFWSTLDAHIFWDDGLTNQLFTKVLPYTGTFPDPLGAVDEYLDREFSIYATYTPSAITGWRKLKYST